MQQDKIPAGQEAYIVWEVSARGKRGRKSGLLSWGEAQIVKASLPTITGRSRCTYEIEPAGQRQETAGEELGEAPH